MPSESSSISTAPSGQPSENPSASDWPTSQPSELPSSSSQPSSRPSSLPFGTPSSRPSSYPSIHPSSSSNPSKSSSSSPTGSQQIPFPENTTTTITVNREISFSNTVIRPDQVDDFAAEIKPTIETKVCADAPASVQRCQVRILSVGDQPVNANSRLRKLLRSLQDSTSLVVAFEVEFESICSTSDCTDTQAFGNIIEDLVTRNLLTTTEDGSLIIDLRRVSTQLSILLSSSIATLINSGIMASPFNFNWYPNWSGTSGTCFNDDNAPSYMHESSGYYESSLDKCCQRYFSWDMYTCTGRAGTVPSGFYPNWGGMETTCLNSIEYPQNVPGYMIQHPEQWLEANAESCCKRHYSWVKNECISLSANNPSIAATFKWYVNHQEEICQQDCAEGVGGPCGGLAMPSDTLYDTPVACCTEKLSWIVTSTCEAQSTGVAAVGTSQWYVDWILKKCVKDCVDSSDANCGGLAKSWDELYGSSTTCCGNHLWYIARNDCTNQLEFDLRM